MADVTVEGATAVYVDGVKVWPTDPPPPPPPPASVQAAPYATTVYGSGRYA